MAAAADPVMLFQEVSPFFFVLMIQKERIDCQPTIRVIASPREISIDFIFRDESFVLIPVKAIPRRVVLIRFCKLVEQRPEEGTAEELFQKIQAEKQRLIAEKKIKKEKGEYGEFKEDEILFDIPTTWKWVRFGSIMINRDSERIPLSVAERSKLEKNFDYYGASGVIDKVDRYLFDKTLLLIGEDGANLLTRSTPIAFLAQGQYWVNNHAHVLDCVEGTLSLEYMMYFVNAISLAKYVTGTAQPKMNQEKMNSIPVPLPPLAEQKRIVEKLEELLPLCEQLK